MIIRVKNNALSNNLMNGRKLSLEAQTALRNLLPGTKVFIGDPGVKEREISDWVGMVGSVEGDELVIEMNTEVNIVPGCRAQVEVIAEVTDKTVDSISKVLTVTFDPLNAKRRSDGRCLYKVWL